MDKCIWCGAIRDTNIKVKTIEDLELFLGPEICYSDIGLQNDGHCWEEIKEK